jgi:FKBP-type peptidyl-prolyl cis-trans isomerase 2
MKQGESRTVNLTAEELPERTKEDYVVRMAHVRRQPKEMRMTIDEYRSRSGKSPEVGQLVVSDPAVSGRVETVTEEEVVLRFSAQAGDVLPTKFGPARIRETENLYEIVIDAREGALVRTAHLVGRISEVDEDYFTLDYRNPFGGQKLICDVAVEKATEVKNKNKTGE